MSYEEARKEHIKEQAAFYERLRDRHVKGFPKGYEKLTKLIEKIRKDK